MDERYFFPQNVRTDYRLTVLFVSLGPRHLKRAAVGGAVILASTYLALRSVSLLQAALVASIAFSSYLAVCCLPVFPDDITIGDLVRRLYDKRNSQQVFPYGEGAYSGGSHLAGPIWPDE